MAWPASAASPVTRVKARLTAFDGRIMTLEPLAPAPKQQVTTKGQPVAAPVTEKMVPFTVALLPDTRFVGASKASFDKIKRGDYVGAAVSEGSSGKLRAQDVYLYAEGLRGTGEGRFPEGERLIVNGAVSEVKPTAPEDKQDGTLTVHYRGAMLSGLGRGRTLCEGRAAPPAYASPLACAGDAVIEVLPGTPVLALTPGSKSLLVPGSLVTVAMTKSADNKDITPGVIVEKLLSVEKPQSPP